jgi:DNA-binding beta-propeller fold protein YncE
MGNVRRLGSLLTLLAVIGTAPAADLLVSNQGGDSVWRLSAQDGRQRGEFRTGDSPHEIAVSPDGRHAVVSNYGGVHSGNTLSVLDLRGGKPTTTIDLGLHSAPHGVQFLSDDEVAVTAEGSGSLLVVNIGEGRVDRVIPLGGGVGHMLALSADGRYAYVTKISKGTVSRIDLLLGTVLQERPAGKGAEGLALRPDAAELWVANRDEGTITVHDPVSLAIKRRMSSRGFPLRIAFSADGKRAFVINSGISELLVLDTGTRLPLARVPLARAGLPILDTALGRAPLPINIALDPRRPRAYVAVSGVDRIAVVDTDTWQVIDYWVTGREPGGVVLVP